MSEKFELPDDLRSLENLLSDCQPPSARLSRDEVLYRAGHAAGQAVYLHSGTANGTGPRPQSGVDRLNLRIWKLATGVLATLAAGLASYVCLDLNGESIPLSAPIKIAQTRMQPQTENQHHEAVNRELSADENTPQQLAGRLKSQVTDRIRVRLPATWNANKSPFAIRHRLTDYDWSLVDFSEPQEQSAQSPQPFNESALAETQAFVLRKKYLKNDVL